MDVLLGEVAPASPGTDMSAVWGVIAPKTVDISLSLLGFGVEVGAGRHDDGGALAGLEGGYGGVGDGGGGEAVPGGGTGRGAGRDGGEPVLELGVVGPDEPVA